VPTYEYQCDKCGRTFEARQRISAPPLKTCETCGGAVRRLISSTTFILKGKGWYVTDYPSAARKKAAESESEKSTAGGDGKKSEKADGKKSEKKDAAPAKATTGASAPAPTSPPSTTSSASSTTSGSSSD
jgi:putative FmdB family regulatory protein